MDDLKARLHSTHLIRGLSFLEKAAEELNRYFDKDRLLSSGPEELEYDFQAIRSKVRHLVELQEKNQFGEHFLGGKYGR